jgi:hypothetical protein
MLGTMPEASRRVLAALLAGLALIALAIALVLSGSPVRVLGANPAAAGATALIIPGGTGACQAGEVLPDGSSALRLDLDAVVGPQVTLTLLSGGRVIARDVHGSGWTGGDVTIPIPRVHRVQEPVQVCFRLGHEREQVLMLGVPARDAGTGASAVRMGIEYLAPGKRSWFASALSVARRLGLGRAPSGTWVALLPLALMALVAMLASGLCIGELGALATNRAKRVRRHAGRLARFSPRRLPRAAWLCALVACLNAAAWSILSPPFQVPDEPAHFAYVQQLAEAHRLPASGGTVYSVEEETALTDLRHSDVQFDPAGKPISTESAQRKLEHDLAQPLPRGDTSDAGTAASEPPLYYALETIPYELGASGSLLDRLELMRLLSAVFGGLTALFAFMFVREALPGARWAWTVGGLGVALAPLLGFISGAVNPDALLFAVSAALFFLLARAFRRGLTHVLAAAVGATIAVGVLTQISFLGLVPGALAGLLIAALRAPAGSRRSSCSAFALALALLVTPAAAYLLLSPSNHETSGLLSGVASHVTAHGSVFDVASYIWQFYLPRLPGTTDYFPGIFTTRQLWFDGLVGLYGWAETVFPGWVEDLALAPAGVVGLLCLRALFTGRAALGRRWLELLVYATMGIGVLSVVGIASYQTNVLTTAGPYWEPRYLLPLLALFGAVLALAARGAGRRWGPAAGTLIVVLILAHDIFSQLLVVSRYYG